MMNMTNDQMTCLYVQALSETEGEKMASSYKRMLSFAGLSEDFTPLSDADMDRIACGLGS